MAEHKEYKVGARRTKKDGSHVYFGYRAKGKNHWFATKALAEARARHPLSRSAKSSGKKGTRKPSAYNMFVKRFIKGGKGDLAAAAKAWRASAEGKKSMAASKAKRATASKPKRHLTSAEAHKISLAAVAAAKKATAHLKAPKAKSSSPKKYKLYQKRKITSGEHAGEFRFHGGAGRWFKTKKAAMEHHATSKK